MDASHVQEGMAHLLRLKCGVRPQVDRPMQPGPGPSCPRWVSDDVAPADEWRATAASLSSVAWALVNTLHRARRWWLIETNTGTHFLPCTTRGAGLRAQRWPDAS